MELAPSDLASTLLHYASVVGFFILWFVLLLGLAQLLRMIVRRTYPKLTQDNLHYGSAFSLAVFLIPPQLFLIFSSLGSLIGDGVKSYSGPSQWLCVWVALLQVNLALYFITQAPWRAFSPIRIFCGIVLSMLVLFTGFPVVVGYLIVFRYYSEYFLFHGLPGFTSGYLNDFYVFSLLLVPVISGWMAFLSREKRRARS